MIPIAIYMIAGYWATGKTLYANKIVIYSGNEFFLKRVMWGTILGWLLIPIAILRVLFHV